MKQKKKSSFDVKAIVHDTEDSVHACLNCGHRTSEMLQEMGSALTASSRDTALEWVKLANEAMACRNYNEVLNLQARALNLGVGSCTNTMGKLCSIAYDGSKKAFAPVASQFWKVPDPRTPWMLGF